ncbi:MAG: 2-oxo acid dehydrogenase subunit E2 [Hyphomicrobiaceae bacterium]|nr:2-oxo acid dehydrogenase subunit E2 [Hyphomicrobiaceae bacterium]
MTPFARRLAAERKIDLDRLPPGADGIIGFREIERAPSSAPRRTGRIDMVEMRKAIANAMARANRDIPHYYVSTTIDMSPLVTWLADHNGSRPVDKCLLYVSPLLKAVAAALKRFESLNGYFEGGTFSPAAEINIGVAVAIRRGGLVTPAILGVDRLDLDQLMTRLNDLGRVVARPLLDVTVAGDHRVSDGRTGAQFLRRLEELLRKPEEL